LALTVAIVQEHFQFRAGWFVVAAYISLLFAVIVFSFRSAWGRKIFWTTLGILFGLHALVGLLLVLLWPGWLTTLGSFLTVIVVSDLLLTMAIVWRVTAAKKQKSR
jgi:hypothetical protein